MDVDDDSHNERILKPEKNSGFLFGLLKSFIVYLRYVIRKTIQPVFFFQYNHRIKPINKKWQYTKKKSSVQKSKTWQPLLKQSVTLQGLKNAGLIDGETDGPRSCYCINWKAFEKFNADFNSLFEKLKEANAKCCED